MADVRLIDANELLASLRSNEGEKILGYSTRMYLCLRAIIQAAPIINPEDCRPQGRWIETNWAEHDGHGEVITYYDVKALKCSKCCHCFKEELLWRKNYCPNCGAKMDGKEQGE